jgi:hypothetical protein
MQCIHLTTSVQQLDFHTVVTNRVDVLYSVRF